MKKKALKRKTDFEKLKKFLTKEKIKYGQGSWDGITPYLFMNFDDNGKSLKSN